MEQLPSNVDKLFSYYLSHGRRSSNFTIRANLTPPSSQKYLFLLPAYTEYWEWRVTWLVKLCIWLHASTYFHSVQCLYVCSCLYGLIWTAYSRQAWPSPLIYIAQLITFTLCHFSLSAIDSSSLKNLLPLFGEHTILCGTSWPAINCKTDR